MAVGARMGRNDPCPCGSGRKYKRCCLARDEAPELLRLRMRRAEGRLVPQVVAYAHERSGYDLVTAAWWESDFAWHARHATQPELVPDQAALRARLGM